MLREEINILTNFISFLWLLFYNDTHKDIESKNNKRLCPTRIRVWNTMKDSDRTKVGTVLGLAVVGILFGYGPFSEGHKLLESDNNVNYYELSSQDNDNNGNGSNISFGASTTKFVKTNAPCDECSCSGYWGIKHDSGAYEGDCQNTDQWGHRCGHSPRHHGLKQY